MLLGQISTSSAIGNKRRVVARVDVAFKVQVFLHISVAFIRPIRWCTKQLFGLIFFKLAWYSIVSTYIHRRDPCNNLHGARNALFFIPIAGSPALQSRIVALWHGSLDYGPLATFHANSECLVVQGPTRHVAAFPFPIFLGEKLVFVELLNSIVRPFQVLNLWQRESSKKNLRKKNRRDFIFLFFSIFSFSPDGIPCWWAVGILPLFCP